MNQTVETSYIPYQSIKCSICGNPMRLFFNNNALQLFFGCSNYKNHVNNKETFDVNEGLDKIKYCNYLI